MTFKRENRYIVIKRKDLDAAAAEGAVDSSFAEVLDIICDNLPTRECLVIESDWPEYEPAWRMIQARVEGATLSPARIEDWEEVAAFKKRVLELIGDCCRFWQPRNEAVRGSFAVLYAQVNDLEIPAAAPTPPASEQQRAVVMPAETLANLHSLLTELQWQWEPYDDHWHTPMGYYCPHCRAEKGVGHNQNCAIAPMLAEFLRLNPHLATPPQENDR